MITFLKKIHTLEKNFDRKAEKFACGHPYLSFAAMFVAMPMFVLTTVCLGSMAVIVPVSWILDFFI